MFANLPKSSVTRQIQRRQYRLRHFDLGNGTIENGPMDMNSMESKSEEVRLYIKCFTDLIEKRVTGDGWNAYFITFMFHPLPGSTKAKLQSMKDSVYRFYATFLTRVIRKPKSVFHAGDRPLLFAAPDYPIPKRKRQSPSDFAINDGLHFHGILVVPLKSRLKEDLIGHLQSRFLTYVKSPLKRIETVLIENRLGFVTDYAFKSVKRNRFSVDDVILLPKSRAEIAPTSELQEEMVKWSMLGLLPPVLPRSPSISCQDVRDSKQLLALAKSFRQYITHGR